MEYTTIPRSLIYKDRDNLNEFGVKTPGTVNYYLFSNLKDIYMASDRAKELILRCFNNTYYICTLIPFDAFPVLIIHSSPLRTRCFAAGKKKKWQIIWQ